MSALPPVPASQSFCPEPLPKPEITWLPTDDNFRIRLSRYRGKVADKGPVMVVHGIYVSSTMFTLPTVTENFAQFLCRRGYDVWLLDWRASTILPVRQFTLDQAAQYDFPPAVDYIRKTTKNETIQAVVHCVGAMAFFISMALGLLKDKLRCVACSQVALHPRVPLFMQMKTKAGLAKLLSRVGITEVSPKADPRYPLFSAMMAAYVNTVHMECSNTTCHRWTFMDGHLYPHDNLNVETHDRLDEFVGACNIQTLRHLEQAAVRGVMARFDYGAESNLDIYGAEIPSTYVETAKPDSFAKVPIKFVFGGSNEVFYPLSSKVTLNWLRELCPGSADQYTSEEIPGYGHWDTFTGARANITSYPAFLELLESCSNHP
jgi:pimeloyl-ACP methyl ester carboxylesterase